MTELVSAIRSSEGEASDYSKEYSIGFSSRYVSLKGRACTSENLKRAKELNYPVLRLSEATLTPENWQQLADFSELTELWLDGTNATDADLTSLKGMTKPRKLSPGRTKVTGEGLRDLKEVPLRALNLGATQPNDAGLEQIVALGKLSQLLLSETAITDAELKYLVMAPLNDLRIAKTPITDAGLTQLAALRGISKLDLSGTKISNEGVKHLVAPQTLLILDLAGTKVSDPALKELKELATLEKLGLARTKTAHSGITAFRAARLKVKVADHVGIVLWEPFRFLGDAPYF
jgi:hypothetical protein